MTLIYNRAVPHGPKTHALIIGCGYFPNLPGAPLHDRKSCPDSARAVVNYLLSVADELTAPLSTIECLISEPAAGANKVPRTDPVHDKRTSEMVDAATQEETEKAGGEWIGRCGAGDHLFFYGCSHGIADRDRSAAMVLEDVHSNAHKKWQQALDVSALAINLPAGTGAGACWIFLDACQEVLPDIVQQVGGLRGFSLVDVTVSQLATAKVRSVALAGSRFGGQAQAPGQGGVAHFTRALLEGLNNCCVERTATGWEVSAKEILFNIKDIAWVAFGERLEAEQLVPFNTKVYLREVNAPIVPVLVKTDPGGAIAQANLVHIIDDAGNPIQTKTNGDLAWRLNMLASDEKVVAEAVFPSGGQFSTTQEGFRILPPYQEVELHP